MGIIKKIITRQPEGYYQQQTPEKHLHAHARAKLARKSLRSRKR